MNKKLFLGKSLIKITPFFMAVFYFFMLTWQSERVAVTDDARFYFEAAESYAEYFEKGFDGFRFFEKSFIDRHWRKNNEHPPLAKILMASGYIIHKHSGFMKKHVSFRVGISILASLLLLFIFSFAKHAFSFRAAVFSSLFFIFFPRVFFHARVATLDFAVGAFSFIFVYAYWRGFNSRFWAWMTGPVFGLALASKLNAPFMAAAVLFHYCFLNRDYILKKPWKIFTVTQFVSMLIFSMPVFFMLWPWMWYDTVQRMINYIAFHLNHYGILMYYLGEIYSEPRPPWHAPLIMTVFTVPVVAFFCVLISPFVYPRRNEKQNNSAFFLMFSAALVSIAVLMFLPAPFYSGVKLFQPFFPFFAVIAGTGLYYLLKKTSFISGKLRYSLFILIFISPVLDIIDLRHDHLSYYSEIAGGTKAALKYRMERQYYDLFYYDMTEFFNEKLSKPANIHVIPNGKEYYHTSRILKDAGMLTEYYNPSEFTDADWLVLIHEYRWPKYPELLRAHRHRKPVFISYRQGVPLYSVYRLKFPE